MFEAPFSPSAYACRARRQSTEKAGIFLHPFPFLMLLLLFVVRVDCSTPLACATSRRCCQALSHALHKPLIGAVRSNARRFQLQLAHDGARARALHGVP